MNPYAAEYLFHILLGSAIAALFIGGAIALDWFFGVL